MTQAVVTEKNNTVVIQPVQSTPVQKIQETRVLVTGIMGPPGASTIAGLTDVDTSTLTPGSMLVYNQITEKWTSTTLLNQQIVDSGQY